MVYDNLSKDCAFNKEEGKLLKAFLDTELFMDSNIKQHYKNVESESTDGFYNGLEKSFARIFDKSPAHGLELIIRPQCTENCDYCYLQKHKQELFHNVLDTDNATILNNLEKFMDYCFHKKQTYPRQIDIFAGDLFYDNLYFDIMEILYKYYKEVYDINPYIFTYTGPEKEGVDGIFQILTPINITVLKDKEKTKRLKDWVKKFADINIFLGLSFSTDGPEVTEHREKNVVDGKNELDNLYKELKEIVLDSRAGIHPVMAPQAIENWSQNYDWWIEFFEDILKDERNVTNSEFQPPILEVRDVEWTNAKIEEYLKVVKHITDVRLKLCNNDIDDLAKHLFSPRGSSLPRLIQYDMIMPYDVSNKLTCSFQNEIHIRLADLAIVPCHRLAYDQLIGGWFETDANGNLTGEIIPHNVTSFISMFTMNPNVAPKCVTCPIKYMCIKGCLGSQYEATGEYLHPVDNVCKLFTAKWNYLIDYWYTIGVIQSAKNQGLFDYEYQKHLKDGINLILKARGYDYQV